jgi:hypothetical protein
MLQDDEKCVSFDLRHLVCEEAVCGLGCMKEFGLGKSTCVCVQLYSSGLVTRTAIFESDRSAKCCVA